jgi:predicted XRE-type DNA-binding protein
MNEDIFVDSKSLDNLFKRNKEIMKFVESGTSYVEIAEMFSMSRARVSQIALDNGVFVKKSLVNFEKRKDKNISWQLY